MDHLNTLEVMYVCVYVCVCVCVCVLTLFFTGPSLHHIFAPFSILHYVTRKLK